MAFTPLIPCEVAPKRTPRSLRGSLRGRQDPLHSEMCCTLLLNLPLATLLYPLMCARGAQYLLTVSRCITDLMSSPSRWSRWTAHTTIVFAERTLVSWIMDGVLNSDCNRKRSLKFSKAKLCRLLFPPARSLPKCYDASTCVLHHNLSHHRHVLRLFDFVDLRSQVIDQVTKR